jgi:hypothetical protein
MTVTLLFAKTPVTIDTITLDASLTETHTAEVETTDHPVEKGANITDHLRAKPRMVTIEGVVTNTPMPDSGANAQNAETSQVRTPDGRVVFESRTPTQDATRAGAAYRDLLALRAGKLITIVTALETFESMAITSIAVPRDARSGQSIRFILQAKEIVQVSSATTQLVEDKVKSKKKLGKKAATPTPEATRSKSVLKSITDWDPLNKLTSVLGGVP